MPEYEQQINLPKRYVEIAEVLAEKYGMSIKKTKRDHLCAYDDKIHMIISLDKHVKGPCQWHVVAVSTALENFNKYVSTNERFYQQEDVIAYLKDESNMHKIYMDAFAKLSWKSTALIKRNKWLKKMWAEAKKQGLGN